MSGIFESIQALRLKVKSISQASCKFTEGFGHSGANGILLTVHPTQLERELVFFK